MMIMNMIWKMIGENLQQKIEDDWEDFVDEEGEEDDF